MHTSVLLHTSIDGLEIRPGDIYVDGTLGSAGHSAEVARRWGSQVKIIGIDLDQDALERSSELLKKITDNFILKQGSFRNIEAILQELGIEQVDRILLDLGISSNQIEDSQRGFSFKRNEPLKMTLSKDGSGVVFTASDIVNGWDEENIITILEGYGEERYARRIAKGIIQARKQKPIETTFDLVDIILKATPNAYHHGRIHPATRTFQAIRITVNDEIESLKEGIEKSFNVLSSGGRLAVISFHSLEDRVVKQFFKQQSVQEKGKLITKKPLIPSDEEIETNPRSRSAKMRIIEKI